MWKNSCQNLKNGFEKNACFDLWKFLTAQIGMKIVTLFYFFDLRRCVVSWTSQIALKVWNTNFWQVVLQLHYRAITICLATVISCTKICLCFSVSEINGDSEPPVVSAHSRLYSLYEKQTCNKWKFGVTRKGEWRNELLKAEMFWRVGRYACACYSNIYPSTE